MNHSTPRGLYALAVVATLAWPALAYRPFDGTDGDVAAFRTRPIPFPDYDWFIRLLDRPSIRAILPPSVSNPHRVSMLSGAASHLAKLGWLVMTIGLGGLALAAVRSRRAPA